MTTVLGLDIGGANIKAADLDGTVRAVAFPMWSRHRELTDALRRLSWMEQPDLVGLTMTAELADCFDCKADGVAWVIDSVCHAFPHSEVRVWLTSGEFAEPQDAVELPELVAAANWHALATWAGRAVPTGPALLIDTGSTTTDVIPLLDGLPVSSGLHDPGRLQHGELVYTGVRRTPLCAVAESVLLSERRVPLAAELFATAQDIHVILGDIAEDRDDTNTADGRSLTIEHCQARLARMVCCDRSELDAGQLQEMARQLADAQRGRVTEAVVQVTQTLQRQLQQLGRTDADQDLPVIISGSGGFLASAAAADAGLTRQLDLTELGHQQTASAACSFAVARLVFERCRDDLLPVVPFQQIEE